MNSTSALAAQTSSMNNINQLVQQFDQNNNTGGYVSQTNGHGRGTNRAEVDDFGVTIIIEGEAQVADCCLVYNIPNRSI